MADINFTNELNTTKVAREPITFYLYDYSWNLSVRPKKIYSPYNLAVIWRTKSEDDFKSPEWARTLDYAFFRNGIYILHCDKSKPGWVSPKIYDQQKEWLSLYNPQGWFLEKWTEDQNWRYFRNDWTHIVKKEKATEKKEVEIKVETKTIAQIPEVIISTMTIDQIIKLADTWNIELPSADKDLKGKEYKEVIIDTLKQAGVIS